MTTHTIHGTRIRYDNNGNTTQAGAGYITFVVSDDQTSFSYSTYDSSNGIAEITIDQSSYAQVEFSSGATPDYQSIYASIANVEWAQGTSTVLVLEFYTGSGTESYALVLDGPELPEVNSASEWDQLLTQIDGLSEPTGVFGPNTDIPYSAINITQTTQNDRFNGTSSDDDFDGGIGSDTLAGDQGNDTLNGGTGNDRLFGNSGDDDLYGNAGSDRLTGGTGSDLLKGGSGRDSLLGGSGNDDLQGGGGKDVLTGGGHADTLSGGRNNDILRGGNGGDDLEGNAGRDQLLGGAGRDELNGGRGADTLSGERGNDTLNGGSGNDTMTGGNGADVFVFNGNFGDDVITDFAPDRKNERIDLSQIDEITSFEDLIDNHISADGDDLVITADADNTITLQDISLADLSANDFLF